MLELHHGGPAASSLKLLICLKEKGLDAALRRLDTDALEQWSPSHRQRAPQGQVPVLIDDGEVMNESSFALQYLVEAYPTPRLAPSDPIGWYDLQAWNSTIDAALAANVNLLGWTATTTPATREDYRTRLGAIPDRERLAGWAAVTADAEASEDQLANARERVGQAVDRIEQALEATGWLVGDAYSIADINTFALTHTLPRLLPATVNADRTPRLMAWLEKIGRRPAVREALEADGEDVYAAPS